jgi:hypothetical protein
MSELSKAFARGIAAVRSTGRHVVTLSVDEFRTTMCLLRLRVGHQAEKRATEATRQDDGGSSKMARAGAYGVARRAKTLARSETGISS